MARPLIHKSLAPIALFIYRRPEHTRKTVESLLACAQSAESPIFVFADGPKSASDVARCEATRSVARELLGDRAVYIERETNIGLANSIVAGVTDLCESHGKVIVIEDDLLLAPNFLKYMNRALDFYVDDDQVMQISGHMFNVPSLARGNQAVFLSLTTSWGWATWKRAWDQFDLDPVGWQESIQDQSFCKAFDMDGNYPYSRMLTQQMTVGIDTWDIQWYYTVFAKRGMVLFPPTTLVRNHGMDRTGTHGRLVRYRRYPPTFSTVSCEFPVQISLPANTAAIYQEIGKDMAGTRTDTIRSLVLTAASILKSRSLRA